MSEYFLNKFAEAELNADSQELIANYLADLQDEGYDPEAYLFDVGLEKAAEYIEKLAAQNIYGYSEDDMVRRFKDALKSEGGGKWDAKAKKSELKRIGDLKDKSYKKSPNFTASGLGGDRQKLMRAKALYEGQNTPKAQEFTDKMQKGWKNDSMNAMKGKYKEDMGATAWARTKLRDAYSKGDVNLKGLAKGYWKSYKQDYKDVKGKAKEKINKGYDTVRGDMKAHPGRYWAGAGGAALGAGALAYYLHKRKKKQMQPKTASAGYGNDLVELAKQKLYGTH